MEFVILKNTTIPQSLMVDSEKTLVIDGRVTILGDAVIKVKNIIILGVLNCAQKLDIDVSDDMFLFGQYKALVARVQTGREYTRINAEAQSKIDALGMEIFATSFGLDYRFKEQLVER